MIILIILEILNDYKFTIHMYWSWNSPSRIEAQFDTSIDFHLWESAYLIWHWASLVVATPILFLGIHYDY